METSYKSKFEVGNTVYFETPVTVLKGTVLKVRLHERFKDYMYTVYFDDNDVRELAEMYLSN